MKQEYIQEIRQILNQPKEKRYWKDLPDYLTDVMKKHGPQETTYATLIDAKDEPLLKAYFSAMRTTEDPPQVIEYFDQCERKFNDHKDAGIWYKGKKIEFVKTAKTQDIPTVPGLSFCCRMISMVEGTGTFSLFKYMVAGNDLREPRVYHQQLYGEVLPRIDLTTVGSSITRVFQSMRFIGLFPSTHPTITCNESGIHNAATTWIGTLLNRNTFPDDPIVHVNGVSAFTLATMISFVSVLTWDVV